MKIKAFIVIVVFVYYFCQSSFCLRKSIKESQNHFAFANNKPDTVSLAQTLANRVRRHGYDDEDQEEYEVVCKHSNTGKLQHAKRNICWILIKVFFISIL